MLDILKIICYNEDTIRWKRRNDFWRDKKLYSHIMSEKPIRTKNNMGLIYIDYLEHIIHYKHYGSSAIKGNLKDFEWLINTIYKDYNFNDFILDNKKLYDII